MRAVVTGANRGIGLELVHQLLERGDSVAAAVRSPDKATDLVALAARFSSLLHVGRCDVAQDASVRSFAAGLGEAPVDLLVNNAGVLGKMQALADVDLDDMLRAYSVNALGAMRVTRALLPLLRKSQAPRAVHVSSDMGAIGRNVDGGAYAYRMSKAALNMASKSMAIDLAVDGIVSVVLNPGWVQTAMGGERAPVRVEDSVAGMLRIIERLTAADSGAFYDLSGAVIPW